MTSDNEQLKFGNELTQSERSISILKLIIHVSISVHEQLHVMQPAPATAPSSVASFTSRRVCIFSVRERTSFSFFRYRVAQMFANLRVAQIFLSGTPTPYGRHPGVQNMI